MVKNTTAINKIATRGAQMAILFLTGIVISITGCATTSTVVDKEIASSLEKKKKLPVRCYFDKLSYPDTNNILDAGIIESFKHIFELVDTRPYDIKVVPEIKDYTFSKIKENCNVDSNCAHCYGLYKVSFAAVIKLYDSKGKLIERIEKNITREARGVGRTTESAQGSKYKKVALARADQEGNAKANIQCINGIIPDIIERVYNNKQIQQTAKAKGGQETASSKTEQKEKAFPEEYENIPFTCVLDLPAEFEELSVRAKFMREFHVNFEQQAGAVENNIGRKLKKRLVQELKKHFSTVKVKGEDIKSVASAYTPFNVVCILDISNPVTSVESKQGYNKAVFKAALKIVTSTGDIYRTKELSDSAPIKLKGLGSFIAQVTDGGGPLEAAIEGSLYKQALENGCKELVEKVMFQVGEMMGAANFIASFSEYAAYSAAKNSRSINDLKHFLAVYPESGHASEIETLLDNTMYDFAKKAESIEGCIDYLDQMQNGLFRRKVCKKLEMLLLEEIRKGNNGFCDMYFQYIQNGDHRDEVSRCCNRN